MLPSMSESKSFLIERLSSSTDFENFRLKHKTSNKWEELKDSFKKENTYVVDRKTFFLTFRDWKRFKRCFDVYSRLLFELPNQL